LIGHIVGKRPIGNFHYLKQLAKRESSAKSRFFCFGSNNNLMNGPRRTNGKHSGLMLRRQLI
jgi:hypothetical protein